MNVVFTQPLPTLLPFVPIMRGGDNEATIQQAVNLLRQDQTLSELENLLGFFATFVIEIPLVQQILRWDMAVLRESPWYQQILKEGEQQGIRQVAINLLNLGLSSAQIAQATGLSEAQIQALQGQAGQERTEDGGRRTETEI